MTRKLIGKHILIDPKIGHGQPTFRGTRIFVSDVLELVASGMSWDGIVWECHGSITEEAIAEAVRLASQVFAERAHEYKLEPLAA